jgi:hypothetical protein
MSGVVFMARSLHGRQWTASCLGDHGSSTCSGLQVHSPLRRGSATGAYEQLGTCLQELEEVWHCLHEYYTGHLITYLPVACLSCFNAAASRM